MRIRNDTHWQTRDLRAVIARVAQNELDAEGRRRLRVVVGYNRQRDRGGCSGHASYGTASHPGHVTILVPSQVIDLVDLAFVAGHELGHAHGVDHRTMRGSARYDRGSGSRAWYAWAAEMPMRRVEPKRTPRPTTTDRLTHARALHRQALTRLRRAQTIEAKWRRRVRDLERREAASPPGHETMAPGSRLPGAIRHGEGDRAS